MNSTSFLPLIDSPNDLSKLKVVESTVSEVMGVGVEELNSHCGSGLG